MIPGLHIANGMIFNGMNPEIQYVLLPGLHGSDELWQPLVDAAQESARLIPVAYPSEVVSDYSLIESFVRDLLPSSAPFVLVAESFSGPVAIRISAAPPDNMSALVLCNSFAAAPAWSALVAFPWKTLFRIPGPSQIIRRYFVGCAAPRSQVRQVRDLVLGSDPAVLASRVRLVLRTDVREQLTRIQLPVLYIRGTEDRLVSMHALRTVRDLLPSVVVSFVPGPHLIFQVAPDEAWLVVKRFMNESAQS